MSAAHGARLPGRIGVAVARCGWRRRPARSPRRLTRSGEAPPCEIAGSRSQPASRQGGATGSLERLLAGGGGDPRIIARRVELINDSLTRAPDNRMLLRTVILHTISPPQLTLH